MKNFRGGVEKFLEGGVEKFSGGVEKFSGVVGIHKLRRGGGGLGFFSEGL